MEDGVQGAGTDLISVMAEFFDQPEAVDALPVGMIKDVYFYDSEKKIPEHLCIGAFHGRTAYPLRKL